MGDPSGAPNHSISKPPTLTSFRTHASTNLNLFSRCQPPPPVHLRAQPRAPPLHRLFLASLAPPLRPLPPLLSAGRRLSSFIGHRLSSFIDHRLSSFIGLHLSSFIGHRLFSSHQLPSLLLSAFHWSPLRAPPIVTSAASPLADHALSHRSELRWPTLLLSVLRLPANSSGTCWVQVRAQVRVTDSLAGSGMGAKLHPWCFSSRVGFSSNRPVLDPLPFLRSDMNLGFGLCSYRNDAASTSATQQSYAVNVVRVASVGELGLPLPPIHTATRSRSLTALSSPFAVSTITNVIFYDEFVVTIERFVTNTLLFMMFFRLCLIL